MIKFFIAVIFCLLLASGLKAQAATGTIQVLIIDRETENPIFRAHAVAFQNDVQKGVGESNWNGLLLLKPLAPGKYVIKGVCKAYCVLEMDDVPVNAGQTTYILLALVTAAGHYYPKVEQVMYQAPMPYRLSTK